MDNNIKVYTFTRMQPQASDTDLLAAQSKLDAYCKENGYRIVGSAFAGYPHRHEKQKCRAARNP